MIENFYQVGGTLPADALCYIKREADKELYLNLKKGDYCYILNARQIGKSSLLVHTAKKLEQEGYISINIDLTLIGSEDITIESWYFSFFYKIVEKLNIDEEIFILWWEECKNLTMVNRFAQFIDKIVLNQSQERIIVFIDEVDSLLGINKWFSVSDFFAVIRAFYNLRSSDKRYNRLTFALFGVARVEDLIQDYNRTPFNIAKNIIIEPFKLKESQKLLVGLGYQKVSKDKILEEIFAYTNGIPYLTQKLLDYISYHPISRLEDITSIVDNLFIQTNFKETNLGYIQKMIMSNQEYNIRMLYLLEKIIKNQKIKKEKSTQEHYLKLTGLIREENGYLKYSCKIYKKVFDISWIENSIKKVDRPISNDLKRWKELNKSKDALLKGEVLEEVNRWALTRDDLSLEESEFLRLSTIEYQKDILKKEKQQSQKKRMQHLITIFVLLSIFTIGLGYEYMELSKKEKELSEKIVIIKNQKQDLEENEKILNSKIEIIKHQNQKLTKMEESFKKQEKLLDNTLFSKTLLDSEKSYIFALKRYQELSKDNPKRYKPKIAKVYNSLGVLYGIQDKPQKAIKNAKKALDIYIHLNQKIYKGKIAKIYNFLADIYRDINLYESENYYKKSINIYKELKENNFVAKLSEAIATLKIKQKQYNKAEEYLKKSINLYKQLSKENPKKYLSSLSYLYEEIGDLYETKKENKLAKKYYNEAYKLFTENPTIYKDEISKLSLKIKINSIDRKDNKQIKPKIDKKNSGWVYLGEYIEDATDEKGEKIKNIWVEKYFSFNKKTKPQELINSYQISSGNLNIRVKPYWGDKKGTLKKGKRIKIIKVENIGTYQWGYIEY